MLDSLDSLTQQFLGGSRRGMRRRCLGRRKQTVVSELPDAERRCKCDARWRREERWGLQRLHYGHAAGAL
jgi:hypothetical protein